MLAIKTELLRTGALTCIWIGASLGVSALSMILVAAYRWVEEAAVITYLISGLALLVAVVLLGTGIYDLNTAELQARNELSHLINVNHLN